MKFKTTEPDRDGSFMVTLSTDENHTLEFDVYGANINLGVNEFCVKNIATSAFSVPVAGQYYKLCELYDLAEAYYFACKAEVDAEYDSLKDLAAEMSSLKQTGRI